MKKFQIGDSVDALVELESLLEYNHIAYVKDSGEYRFIFADRGLKWETVCRPLQEGAVLIYGFYPFKLTSCPAVQQFCESVNSRVRYGAMMFQDDQLVFRTCADLFDIYSSYETIARALEYNADVIVRFWVRAASCMQNTAAARNLL